MDENSNIGGRDENSNICGGDVNARIVKQAPPFLQYLVLSRVQPPCTHCSFLCTVLNSEKCSPVPNQIVSYSGLICHTLPRPIQE